MLPQVGAEVSTWRVVGGGRCETGVAAGWQRGRLEQQERAAGRGPSPTKCWPESSRGGGMLGRGNRFWCGRVAS